MVKLTTGAIEARSRKSYKIFSESTSMHGFHEVYTAKENCWKIFWLAIVIGALAVTSYQVFRAIRQYVSQTSLSNIKPLADDIMYPPLSLCYLHWIPWLDWKKAYSLNFTRESILYSLSFLTPIFSPTYFNETEAEQSLLENMALQNISTISDLYKRIAKSLPMVIGLYDKAVLSDDPPFFKDIEIRWKDSDLVLCYKVDGEEIMKVFNMKNAGLPAIHPQDSTFNFSTQDFKYEMVSDYLSYEEYNFYMAYWLHVKTNYWIMTAFDFLKNFTAMTFPYRIYPDTYSERFVEISTEYDSYTIVMQSTAHRLMNKDNFHCQQDQKAIATDETCSDKCFADELKNMNLCLRLDQAVLLNADMPDNLCRKDIRFLEEFFGADNSSSNTSSVSDWFSSDNLDEGEEIFAGNISQNATLLQMEEKIKAKVDTCHAQCTPCERWKYEFASSNAILPPAVKTLSFTNQTDIKVVYPSKHDILIVIEENSQTWEDFVGNVGGLLGIWTGASILSFIQLVYLCCCYDNTCDSVANVCRPKTRRSKLLFVPAENNKHGENNFTPSICTIIVDNVNNSTN